MRNAKLWSVLLAAVLVCACIAGVLFTGASASDTRIPTATTTYVVGTDGATIRACLEKAATQTWAEDTVLEIRFSGEDSSIYASPDAANGISGYTMFEVNSIFREDNTQLPIVIRGMDEDRAAVIKTSSNSYNATNDYFFTNLTIAGGASGATVSFYAGSGELVFENTKHNNYNYTWYYGDCQVTDAWEGWDAAKLEANKGDKGLVETGIVFGNGTKFYDTFITGNDDTQRISAVGFNGDTTTNPVLVALKRSDANVTAALTEGEVEGVREAAKNATYKQGNVVTIDECLVKPWDTQTYLVLDSGTANPTSYEYGYASARKGISPVQEAKIEAISGGYQYLSAESHTSKINETYAGNTTVIMRGGKTLSNAVGIRLTNIAMLVGDLTLEIHEDDPSVPTYTSFVQASQTGATSTVFGNYHFLMTGGTIGKGHSVATLGSDGNQLEDSNGKKWDHYDSNDGYWGAPLATGTIVNEVQGGTIWAFYGSRFANSYVNTPVSIVLPGTGETLTAKVSIHNKISGGIIGGPKVEGDRTDSAGNKVDIQQGTKAFYGASKGTTKVTAVCNEITGGTIYKFNAGSVGTSRSYAPADLYNFIYGTKEAYPTFLCDFYGCNSKGAYNITNVIKGYPKFNDGTTKRWIHGGHALNGTTTSVTNYLGGLPEFKDFFGGTPSSSLLSGSNAAITHLRNHFAFDDTEKSAYGEIWAGNAYFKIKARDGGEKSEGNSANYVGSTLESTIYSGTYGTFRNESAAGEDRPNAVLNIYGGTWTGAFLPVNRTSTGTFYQGRTFTTNIYGGTFKGTAYMGGQNARKQPFVNNIYGGTFESYYYGGGDDWADSVVNNIYGGTFNAMYCGGGYKCGSNSIVNNIYGGKWSGAADFMGAYAPATETKYHIAGTIENNIYGGDLGSGWTYMGHRDGPATTITNHIYSGADNPCRNPENTELYQYYNADTMKEAGVLLRDQVVCGSGYSEGYVTKNTVDTITNTLEGGIWLKADGSVANITFHGGMRWGTAGNVTNNFIKGRYFRTFGGSDYGYITGTLTNNFGKALAEGEEAPELYFSEYTYCGGLNNTNLGSKIEAALAVDEANRNDTQKLWAEMAATYGEDLEAGAGAVVNNVYYGNYHQFQGGSFQEANSDRQSKFGSITNNVYGGTFDKRGTENSVFAGGSIRSTIYVNGITNNIYGGTFNGNYYGGANGAGTVVCPTITNNIYGGEGNKTENAFMYLGNGVPTFNGVVINTINDFTAHKTYVMGGSTNVHNAPEGAAYAIETTISGGTFCGFWGQGGGTTSDLTGNIKTTVNGGTFNGYGSASHMRNSIAGGSRNGSTNGNIELIINDGTFTADVVGGIIWGSEKDSLKKIDGNVTVTIKGGDFQEDVYALCRVENAIAITGTAVVNVEQTAGVALKLGGEAYIDSFTANGEIIEIDAETDLKIAALTGNIALKQTVGWLARDYATLPAGSVYSVDTVPGAYGAYVADETILIKGMAIAPAGATIRLAERLGVRILLDQNDVEAYGEAITYTVKLGDTTLASGGYEEICANNYSILFDGIGLAQFGTKFTVTSSVTEDITYSIVELAEVAQTAWANNAKWKAYADAIIELHNVYNGGENTLTPAAVATVPVAAKGELGDAIVACEETNATLLMSDAAGVRMSIVLTEAPASAKFVVAGKEFAAKIEGNTISADIFFAHEFLADEFVISVQNAEGQVYMTYTASIEAMANQLANDANNEKKDNAEAFLVYIQKAVACK